MSSCKNTGFQDDTEHIWQKEKLCISCVASLLISVFFDRKMRDDF